MALPVQWIAVGGGLAYMLFTGSISIKQVVTVLVLLGGGALFMLYRFQEALLYQPRIFPQHLTPKDNPPGMRTPCEHQIPWEDVRLTTSDGLKLHAWFLRPESIAERRTRATVLFFCENAGNHGLRMQNLRMMYEGLNVNIAVLSYRGYGESEGVPAEEGLYLDAEAMFQWVLNREDIDRTRIVLFGRSLGGGVAIDLASKHESDSSSVPSLRGELSAIIVENTFASIGDMVSVLFPYVSFLKGLILRLKWESNIKIKEITKPILFVSGLQDEIVPAQQMTTLFRAAVSSSQKEMVTFADGTHNDTWMRGGSEYLQKLKTFLEKHAGPGSAVKNASAATARAAL